MLNEIKYIVTDLDDTLFPDGSTIDPKYYDLFISIIKSGIKLIINTSRPFCLANKAFPPSIQKYIIANNGSEIYSPSSDLIYLSPIKDSIIDKINIYLERLDIKSLIFFKNGSFFPNMFSKDIKISEYYSNKYKPIKIIPLITPTINYKTTCIILRVGSSIPNDIVEVMSSLTDFRLYSDKIVIWPKEATKFNGLLELFKIQHWNFIGKDILSFGDSKDDFEYLAHTNGYQIIENRQEKFPNLKYISKYSEIYDEYLQLTSID